MKGRSTVGRRPSAGTPDDAAGGEEAGAGRRAPAGAAVWQVLDTVPDPEVPVLSVVELGIVRDAQVLDSGAVEVSITPTYSGCPAMQAIEADITAALHAAGYPDVQLRTVFIPAWTTDWMGEAAREKLRAYGIAAPGRQRPGEDDLIPLLRRTAVEIVPCPYCGSGQTVLRSEFGSTSCKSIRFCEACLQPFEQFKAI